MNGICGILAHLESIQSHLIQTLRLYRHQLRLFHAPKSSAIAEKFSAKSIIRTNYALEYNLLSKNRVTHFRPIMTFLVKLLETHPMMSAIIGFIKTG